MGLLDSFINDPGTQLGIGLLAASGPTTDPNRSGFGQRLAGAMQGVNLQQQEALKAKLLQSQIDENASQNAMRQSQMTRAAQLQAMTNGLFNGGGMGGGSAPGSMPVTSGGMDSNTPSGGGFAIGVNPGVSMQQPSSQNVTPQQAAGLRGVPLEKVAALKAAGGPDLIDAWKLANVPTQLSAGGYTQLPGQAPQYLPDPTKGVDFRNGAVSALPGSDVLATLAGQQAAAQAGAKMPFDIQADRARQFTQAQLDPMKAINQSTGDTDYVSRLALSGAGQPGMGAAGAGQAGGVSLGGNMVPGAGAAPGAQQPQNPYIADRNPIKQQSQIALNDNWIKSTYQPVKDAGSTATDLQNSIQAMRGIDFNSGWGAENKANAAAFLEGLGVNVGSSKLYAANAQKFQSVAMDRLLTTLGAQKGPQTEGDAQRAQQTFVKLNNTPQANQFILDFAQAKANMDQRRAQYYEAALPLAQKAGDLTRVDREWRKIQGSVWADPILQGWSK
jgi:hypothetical protein